jgi:hypothetical protein
VFDNRRRVDPRNVDHHTASAPGDSFSGHPSDIWVRNDISNLSTKINHLAKVSNDVTSGEVTIVNEVSEFNS